MRLRTLGLTEDAVDALDSATNNLRRILHSVAAECAEANGLSAITPDCIERARKRVTQTLMSERFTELRTIRQFGNRSEPQSDPHRRFSAAPGADPETRGDGDVPSSKELAGVR